MPVQIITHTVKSSGGDYTSLSAWESAQQRDLTSGSAISGTITGTDGQIEKAECYNFDLNNTLTINGWTTTASNYIWVMAPTGERHDGRPRDTSASGFRVRNGGNLFGVNVSYHYVLEGLEITITSTNTSDRNPLFGLSSTTVTNGNLLVKECILQNWNDVGRCFRPQNAMARVTFTNCMVLHAGENPAIDFGVTAAASLGVVKHCTVVFNGSTATAGVSNTGITGAHEIWNTYAGNFAGGDFANGTVTATGKNNASLDTTASTIYGTGSLTGLAPAQQFVGWAGIGATTLDLHLSASSSLVGAGSTATGVSDVTIDIDGDTRS